LIYQLSLAIALDTNRAPPGGGVDFKSSLFPVFPTSARASSDFRAGSFLSEILRKAGVVRRLILIASPT
jgi:hypothetical protein